jgi:hypothetical protein
MEISIINKQGKKKAGFIKSTRIDDHLLMSITYQTKPEFFKELQRLLLKYYNLKLMSGEGKIGSSIILKEVLDTFNTTKHGLAWGRKKQKRKLKENGKQRI